MTGWGKNKEEESIREISRKFKALSTYNNYPLERNYPYTLLINMILQPSLWTLYLINLILISMIFPSQNTSHKVSNLLLIQNYHFTPLNRQIFYCRKIVRKFADVTILAKPVASTSLVPKEIAKWLNETKRMKRIVERKKGNKKSLSNKSNKKKAQ